MDFTLFRSASFAGIVRPVAVPPPANLRLWAAAAPAEAATAAWRASSPRTSFTWPSAPSPAAV